MRVLFASDVHKTYRPSEAHAVEWLLSLIGSLRPDALVSAGDWDEGSRRTTSSGSPLGQGL